MPWPQRSGKSALTGHGDRAKSSEPSPPRRVAINRAGSSRKAIRISVDSLENLAAGRVAPAPTDRSAVNGATGAAAAPVDIASAFGPRGGPRLYKLFLLSPWVLFQLLIYRLPLITGLRLYSFRRRDEPIAHRLDANSVPLFLRRSHTFSAGAGDDHNFSLPLPPVTSAPTPPSLYIYMYISRAPLSSRSARVKWAEGG